MFSALPSIWISAYDSQAEWLRVTEQVNAVNDLIASTDRLYIDDYRPFEVPAYCSVCSMVQRMTFDWSLTFVGNGRLHIAWTELLACRHCTMNSRQRAVWDFIGSIIRPSPEARIYMPEAVTPAFAHWRQRFPRCEGSEFVSFDAVPGSYHQHCGLSVRHEDMTRLSYADRTFDMIISQDVFEHIPDFHAAFRECARVLKEGGHLIFSIPFFPEKAKTDIRARLMPGGTIDHILPPELHGNPMSTDGALCFQNFGWDILDVLRNEGFSQARSHHYWGPWQGHLGAPFFLFSAIK